MSRLPLTRAGRQTLVYGVLAGCGPVLTAVLIWAMVVIRSWHEVAAERRLDRFAELALCLAGGLLIIITALACFVSIRAIRIGPDGIAAQGDGAGSTEAAADEGDAR